MYYTNLFVIVFFNCIDKCIDNLVLIIVILHECLRLAMLNKFMYHWSEENCWKFASNISLFNMKKQPFDSFTSISTCTYLLTIFTFHVQVHVHFYIQLNTCYSLWHHFFFLKHISKTARILVNHNRGTKQIKTRHRNLTKQTH